MRSAHVTLRSVLVLAAIATSSSACAGPTLEERFEQAMTYAEFTGSDTTRQREWRVSEGRAAVSASAFADRVRGMPGTWRLLVVAESWCGDAINSVPYLAALDSAAPNLEMRLVRKKDAKALLKAHEFEGRQATPLVLLIDEQGAERGAWIERPATLRRYLKTNCSADEKQQVRDWYASDAGRSMLNEITTLIATSVQRPGRT